VLSFIYAEEALKQLTPSRPPQSLAITLHFGNFADSSPSQEVMPTSVVCSGPPEFKRKPVRRRAVGQFATRLLVESVPSRRDKSCPAVTTPFNYRGGR
jgi:hypothetical protein